MAITLEISGITDAKIGVPNAGNTAIDYYDVPYANQATQAANRTDITFEGDNDTHKVFSSADLTGTLRFDRLSSDLLAKLWGKRIYTGDGVGSVTVTTPGSGYTSAPGVTFGTSPATGGTATGVAVLGTGGAAGTVVGVTVTFAGTQIHATHGKRLPASAARRGPDPAANSPDISKK